MWEPDAHSRLEGATCLARGHSWRSVVAVGRLLLLPALLLPTACKSDNRISLADMMQREHALAEAPAVPIEHERLALTDFHPYQVGPRDVLGIQMTGLMDDRYAPTVLQVRVHRDGTISLPVVGSIKVGGLDLGQVEQAIIDAHVPDVVTDMAVYVELAATENTTVLVLGAAAAPGLVKLAHNERNPLYAIASAGGFSTTSSGRVRLKPIRPERHELVFDFNDVNDVRRALSGPPLESGDVLTVEAAENAAVYVGGLVNRPGPILIPPDSTLSVVRAVTAAGGLRDYLDVKEATLVRKLTDGDQVHVKLDLGKMLVGRAPDLELKPGDVLQIAHTADTFVQEWFFQNVMVGPFSVGMRYDPLAQYNASRAIRSSRGAYGGSLSQSITNSLASSIPSLLIPPVPAP